MRSKSYDYKHMVDCRMAYRDDVMIKQKVALLIFVALYSERLLLSYKLTNWGSMEPTNPEHWNLLRVFWFQRGTILVPCTLEVPPVEHVVPLVEHVVPRF
jgi:hypothetical protein